jgi:uncharacterized protein YkwD
MKINKHAKLSLLFYTFVVSAVMVLGYNAVSYHSTKAEVVLDQEERAFIKEINAYRKSKGRKAIKISTKLSKAAQAMGEDMADHPDAINHEHKDSQGRLPAERAAIYGYTDGVGENLAAGYETNDDVFKAWKGSSEHNANMLDKDYEVMGIARVTTGNNYKWYWVNMFGDTEHAGDLMDESDYGPMIKVRVTVVNADGKAIRKAKVSVLNKNYHKLSGGNTKSNGKNSFSVSPRNEFYVRVSASGYSAYTKRVKPGTKDDVTVKIWLEKS